MRRTSRKPTMLVALGAVVVASHAAGEQNGQRTAYEPKPGDFVVVCTLFNGRPPGATASTPTEPITYDPRFAIGARVERIALGESPWRAGVLVTFVIHSPTLLLGPSFAGQQFALTFSPLRPRTNSDKLWFDPETRYLLQRIEPMQAFKSRDSEAAVRQQSGGRSADRGLDLRCLSADQMSCGCSLKIVALSCQASHSTGWIAHFASDLHQGSPLRLNLGGRDISLRSRRPVTNAFPYGKGDRWVEEYEGEGLKVAIRYRPAKSTCQTRRAQTDASISTSPQTSSSAGLKVVPVRIKRWAHAGADVQDVKVSFARPPIFENCGWRGDGQQALRGSSAFLEQCSGNRSGRARAGSSCRSRCTGVRRITGARCPGAAPRARGGS